MKKLVIVLVLVGASAGIAFYAGRVTSDPAPAADGQAAGGGRGGGRGNAGGGGGRGGRGAAGPLTVEVALAKKGTVSEQLTLVGNLVGDATVSVVPRVAGRLQSISVRLGDRVSRGQRIAKIEDFELQEQLKQAEAAQDVAQATIRQREADLKLAETNAERSRNLFARQLLPKQTLDDTEARYQAAVAQLDLARAQSSQSNARLDELRITMSNTEIVSPVNGFVARRSADPGAFVGQNAPIVDVVDITRVRLVANVVEKDLKQIGAGDDAVVEVDAFPGQMFDGRIARVSPVLDPTTRTASIEIEIPNPGFLLKPGMYARVGVTISQKPDALVVPVNAVLDVGGRRGVFLAQQNNTATFKPVRVGIEEATQIEILEGLSEGDRVVTTGAGSLREGDPFLLDRPSGRSGDEGEGGPVATGSQAPGGRGAGAPAEGGGRRGRGGRRGGQ